MQSRQRFGVAILGLAGALLLGGSGQCQAGIIITITQNGANVDATGSGTVNLASLTLFVSENLIDDLVIPSAGIVGIGDNSQRSTDAYSGATGPASFGPGDLTFATTGAGNLFFLDRTSSTSDPLIDVPAGYISGDNLSGSATWDNTTIAGLGLTPGTYTYTWGSGAIADFLTVQIGPAATTVPEPTSLALFALGGLGLAGWRRWRKHGATTA